MEGNIYFFRGSVGVKTSVKSICCFSMNGETNMSLVGESTIFDLHGILRINMMMLDVYVRFLQEPTITNVFGRGFFASIAVANEGLTRKPLLKLNMRCHLGGHWNPGRKPHPYMYLPKPFGEAEFPFAENSSMCLRIVHVSCIPAPC